MNNRGHANYSVLNDCQSYLMGKKFPYNSVTVCYLPTGVGYHVFIMEDQKEMVTEEVKTMLKIKGFTHTFVEGKTRE